MAKINRQLRMTAYDAFKSLIANGFSRKEIIDKIKAEFEVPPGTLYDWYKDKHVPWGRAGRLVYRSETFYVLGALVGDGCIYKWKPTHNHVILIGDKKFVTKYSKYLIICTKQKVRPYIDRTKNIWFVKINNFELCELFKKVRSNLVDLETLITSNGQRASLMFVEGFFDAEGCVKLVREKSRIIPKVCLDITNTNYELLILVQRLLLENLNIESRFSIQKPYGNRKTCYHLRIYRKDDVRKFLKLVPTTKFKANKVNPVKSWVNR